MFHKSRENRNRVCLLDIDLALLWLTSQEYLLPLFLWVLLKVAAE